jgi:hypothetical protein
MKGKPERKGGCQNERNIKNDNPSGRQNEMQKE